MRQRTSYFQKYNQTSIKVDFSSGIWAYEFLWIKKTAIFSNFYQAIISYIVENAETDPAKAFRCKLYNVRNF